MPPSSHIKVPLLLTKTLPPLAPNRSSSFISSDILPKGHAIPLVTVKPVAFLPPAPPAAAYVENVVSPPGLPVVEPDVGSAPPAPIFMLIVAPGDTSIFSL